MREPRMASSPRWPSPRGCGRERCWRVWGPVEPGARGSCRAPPWRCRQQQQQVILRTLTQSACVAQGSSCASEGHWVHSRHLRSHLALRGAHAAESAVRRARRRSRHTRHCPPCGPGPRTAPVCRARVRQGPPRQRSSPPSCSSGRRRAGLRARASRCLPWPGPRRTWTPRRGGRAPPRRAPLGRPPRARRRPDRRASCRRGSR
mmetsp:Transcript_9599/g.28411  ORF Transcript_9599/g.28411 Transcript_9599/m.28411 type:complete len:204 (-) Transcript_9599:1294-1905(-)